MLLIGTFAKNMKHTDAATGEKHTDGVSIYLLMKGGGKY